MRGGGGESSPNFKHILLIRIPVQENAPTFITLQNAKNEFYTPFTCFNKSEFIDFFCSLGYELIDEWSDPFDAVMIPFHRDKSVHKSVGFYFRAKVN